MDDYAGAFDPHFALERLSHRALGVHPAFLLRGLRLGEHPIGLGLRFGDDAVGLDLRLPAQARDVGVERAHEVGEPDRHRLVRILSGSRALGRLGPLPASLVELLSELSNVGLERLDPVGDEAEVREHLARVVATSHDLELGRGRGGGVRGCRRVWGRA